MEENVVFIIFKSVMKPIIMNSFHTLLILIQCANFCKCEAEALINSLPPTAADANLVNTQTIEVKIEGMTCSMCSQALTNAVRAMDGVIECHIRCVNVVV